MSSPKENIQLQIIDLCLRIDLAANKIYDRFAEKSDSEELVEFWNQVSEEEKNHAEYWREIKERVKGGEFPLLFDDPITIRDELRSNFSLAESILAQVDRDLTTREMFNLAMRMEFYLIHPAFETLFRLASDNLELPDTVEDYHKHIGRFVEALSSQKHDEFALMGEMLSKLWKANTRVSTYLEREKHLGSLVSMCSSCKKIRSSDGNWVPIEEFVSEQSHADITHSLCDNCVATLYPSYIPEKSE